MKVQVPMVGQGVAGSPYQPKYVLHGQMHIAPTTGVVIFTDDSFTEEELALEGVVILEGAPPVVTEEVTEEKEDEEKPEPVTKTGGRAYGRKGKR